MQHHFLVDTITSFPRELTCKFNGASIINFLGSVSGGDVGFGDGDGDLALTGLNSIVAVVVDVEFGSNSGNFMSGSSDLKVTLGIGASRSDFVLKGEG